MAGGGGRSLQETPTWAVAVVCFVLVSVSIVIEHLLHMVGKWFMKKHKKALYEALEKIKAELMLMGFISLLLTVLQDHIAKICISKSLASTWHPCSKSQEEKLNKGQDLTFGGGSAHRRLFSMLETGESTRRILAGAGYDRCAAQGKVPLVSTTAIHELHIFIFVLAVFHVLYCIVTWALSKAKMRSWEAWEMETRTADYQFSHDPERFRFARDTSFGKRHLHFWSDKTVLLWIVCFFRQFIRSVPKVDYLTLRHGFITAHLAPHSETNFDFQKYISRSLEEDFKFVVGINPVIWFSAVIFLLCNTYGWYSYLWLPFIPLVIILLIGTKLQVIITRMGLAVQDRGEVVKGTPTVQPGDSFFWFNSPRLTLYLIHFVLFQNAFQLAFFVFSAAKYKLKSCFHKKTEDIIIRISMGILTQILCSYVTLPLYALVTQMGSNMSSTIFNDKVAKALRHWHHNARKNVKSGRVTPTTSRPGTPLTSAPGTPLHGSTSPVNLLHRHSGQSENQGWAMEIPQSASYHNEDDVPWSRQEEREGIDLELSSVHSPSEHQAVQDQHQIDIASSDFSFTGRRRQS